MVVDQRYYAHVPPNSFSERLMISARDRIFSDFMSRMLPSPDHRILDVGVSDVVNDGANVLERSYPYQENITACGLSDAPDFRAAFPNVDYRRIEPNASLPFEANCFDIACWSMSTVLKNRCYLSASCAASPAVFLSPCRTSFSRSSITPRCRSLTISRTYSKWLARLTSQDDWANDENLILMTRKRLWRIAASWGRTATVGYTGLRLVPFSSNLFLIPN